MLPHNINSNNNRHITHQTIMGHSPDGKQLPLEIKAEHLKQYLCISPQCLKSITIAPYLLKSANHSNI